MGRWEPDAVGRLQQAALELYAERGFEPTAVADIAERAGLTERTFFRYFADKREVLFSGSGELLELFEGGGHERAANRCRRSTRWARRCGRRAAFFDGRIEQPASAKP